jgi:transcriptional regulator with XRE-family HTH domain
MPAHIFTKEEKEPKTPEQVLGRLIRRERVIRDWSQAELARRSSTGLCGFSARKISLIEQGDTNLTAIELFEIATTLAVPVEKFRVTKQMVF